MTEKAVPESPPTTKAVAVLGSSGGNLRSHGGDDPVRLIQDVARQLTAAGMALAEVQFVSAQASMDGISDSTPAQLWALADGQPAVVAEGPLEETLTAENLEATFDLRLTLTQNGGRWAARAV